MLSFQKHCSKCGTRRFLAMCSNSECSERVPNVHSLILYWASKEKQPQANTKTDLYCYLDLLFEELWEIIFSYCGIAINNHETLQLEVWMKLRSVSKMWFSRLESVRFSSIKLNSVTYMTKFDRKYETYIWKVPQKIINSVRCLSVTITKPHNNKQTAINLRFSSSFIPLPEAKELKFIISDEYETGVVSWEPDKITFPLRKNIYSKIPSLQVIEIMHTIIADKKHIMTFTTRIHPKKKTVSTFVMKKEKDFVNFDSIHIRINFSEFGGMQIKKVENLILTGKTWALQELQEFVILLPSLRVLIVDISDSKEEEDEIKNWVIRKFGPNFRSRKVENCLHFIDENLINSAV